MPIDERDLGVRPVHEEMMALAEKRDEERLILRSLLESTVQQAQRAMHIGDPALAAELYELVAERYRAQGFIGEADSWAGRARDARTVERLRKRRAKKGRL